MSADDAGPGPQVRRLDEDLGLAVCRVPLSGRTLVTYARDHVTVRTPSRPSYLDGNTLDLVLPPDPAGVGGWVDRFSETIARLGAEQVQLRWEEPLAPDAPPSASKPHPAVAAAAAALGLTISSATVLLLDAPIDPGVELEVSPVAAPSAVPGLGTDRRWHGAAVLDRYREGEGPESWTEAARDVSGAGAWRLDVQRELANSGRAQLWVATRHGAPVARVVIYDDRQRLAVVEDLVVHPVHRHRGIAAGLAHRAVTEHLAAFGRERVGVVVAPSSPGESVFRRIGFRPHATVFRARGALGSARPRR